MMSRFFINTTPRLDDLFLFRIRAIIRLVKGKIPLIFSASPENRLHNDKSATISKKNPFCILLHINIFY